MRLSNLTSSIFAVCLATSAAPITAQEWYARDNPLLPEGERASPICHISSGEELPLIMFTFERERARFGVRAYEFGNRSGVHEYSGTLPSGASLTVSLGTDLSSDVAVLSLSDRESGLRFVEHFLAFGDFSLTGNGIHIEIPALPSASGEIENLQNCLKALDNG